MIYILYFTQKEKTALSVGGAKRYIVIIGELPNPATVPATGYALETILIADGSAEKLPAGFPVGTRLIPVAA